MEEKEVLVKDTKNSMEIQKALEEFSSILQGSS